MVARARSLGDDFPPCTFPQGIRQVPEACERPNEAFAFALLSTRLEFSMMMQSPDQLRIFTGGEVIPKERVLLDDLFYVQCNDPQIEK